MIPRSAGGKVNWENAVTACKPCNHKKGTKLWKPLRMPYKPDYYNLVAKWRNRPITIEHPSWYEYLGIEQRKEATG
jgi:5-methylcytosine-specific restriction endonuclease McrA